jgi:orotate phosphoribosyltransferase-like protein
MARRRRVLGPQLAEQAARLRDQGLVTTEIAERLGVSERTAYRALRQAPERLGAHVYAPPPP